MNARPVRMQAADVDVDHLLPLGDLGLLERGAEHHAGVRDDEVDAAELGADGVGDALDVVRVGDVGGDREDAFEGLEAIGAAGDGGDPRALVARAAGRSRRRCRCWLR